MTKLYFIGGASGSGKTTILLELQKILGNSIDVYDFDDIGVPKNADKKWRQKSTEKWLKKLISEDKNACLLGQVVLGEILACPSAQQLDKINFCLLDVADFERIKRLKHRNTYGADQNMLNWAAWLRVHIHDPQWTQHVLKDNCWNKLNFSVWEQKIRWTDKVVTKLIDTTQLSVKEVTKQVANWINDSKIKFKIIPHLKMHKNLCSTNHLMKKNIKFLKKLPKEIQKKRVLIHEQYEKAYGIICNYKKFAIVIENDSKEIVGALEGYTAFAEIYIDDLWIDPNYRSKGYGKKLIEAVEDHFAGKGFNNINLCTSEFSAPEFYKKCGFKKEFTRINKKNPQFNKTYFVKFFKDKNQHQGLI